MTASPLPTPRAVLSHPDGGSSDIDVRFVVSPAAGIFQPADVELFTTDGEIITQNGIIGHVHGPGRIEPVTSFCSGFLLDLLVEPGERVRPAQRIAWLHPIDRPHTRPEIPTR